MENISIGVILAQIINFSILFFAFKYFLGKKLTDAIYERREKIEKIEKGDLEVAKRINQAEKEAQEILEKARETSRNMLETAESAAKKREEEILKNAKEEAKTIIEGARREIEKERKAMLNSIKSKVINLALQINQKLFYKENLNKEFIESQLEKINN